MNKIKYYCTLILLLSCLYVHAENDYRRYVDEIVDTQDFDNSIYISLTDDTYWSLTFSAHNTSLLDQIDDILPSGEEVHIKINRLTDEYFLVTKEGTEFNVMLSDETRELIPTLTEKEEILIAEGGWFTSAEYEHIVYLSDGSKWRVGSDSFLKSNLEEWKVGDKVIPGVDGNEEYSLINVDAPYAKHSFHDIDDLREIDNVKKL